MSSCDAETPHGVVLFRSVQAALAAEKILAGANLAHQLIAVPRHISSNCGFCLRIRWADRERVARLLPKDALGVEGIVPL